VYFKVVDQLLLKHFREKCELRLTESLSLVMMYPATHTQLSENVCTVKCDIYTRIYSMEQSP